MRMINGTFNDKAKEVSEPVRANPRHWSDPQRLQKPSKTAKNGRISATLSGRPQICQLCQEISTVVHRHRRRHRHSLLHLVFFCHQRHHQRHLKVFQSGISSSHLLWPRKIARFKIHRLSVPCAHFGRANILGPSQTRLMYSHGDARGQYYWLTETIQHGKIVALLGIKADLEICHGLHFTVW